MENEEVDYTELKYVLYARKSSEDEERQTKSIPHQIDECKTRAKRLGIKIAKGSIVEESKSAKSPRKRDAFNQMIKDIKNGKYNAILAWNPDRLARNMIEAGIIIDLIDQGIIKDLQFVTHHFTNDANGKMLLGMAFVLSKQYSDKLGQDVRRGVRKRFEEEGRTSTSKNGYKNEGGRHYPDGKNFDLIKEAWQKRLDGESLKSIANWLQLEGYERKSKTGRTYKPLTKQKLGKMFQDSFYYGELVQANSVVDLREIYDFTPAVSEEDFFIIQEMGRGRHSVPRKRKSFYPLKEMVYCGYCNGSMVVGPSTSSGGGKLLYYRCDNEDCFRNSEENKQLKALKDPNYIRPSTRAKVVFNWMYKYLEQSLNFTEEEYVEYLEILEEDAEKKRLGLKQKLHNREGVLKQVNSKIAHISRKIIDYEKGSRIWEENSKEVKRLADIQANAEDDIDELKSEINNLITNKLSLKEFLNFSNSASQKVKAGTAEEKDTLCRMIFLNLVVSDKEVLKYKVKEPFKTLIKVREVSSGRLYGTEFVTISLLMSQVIQYLFELMPVLVL